MKKTIGIIGFAAIAATMIFSAMLPISCNKVDDEQITKVNTQKGTGLVDPIEFGKLHNKYLIEAINISKSNRKLTSKQAFLAVKIANVSSTMQSKIFDSFSNTSSEQMKDSIFIHLKNPLAKGFFNQIDQALNSATNYKKLNDELDDIALSINTNLSGTDWDIIMVYLETIRASANVWFSKDMGGNGIGYGFKTGSYGTENITLKELKLSSTSTKESPQSNIPNWVAKDGRGAGYGMVLWSFSAFFGPVGGVGFVYGAVSGAVTSSFLP